MFKLYFMLYIKMREYLFFVSLKTMKKIISKFYFA